MKKKPTIRDIALESGVSVSTVSLVLNNKPGISQETRRRVLKVAEDLSYPFKTADSNATSQRLSKIGMVIKTDPGSPPQANPFYSKVTLGIEEACRRKSISLLFATLPVDEENCPVEAPQLLFNERLDGLLMVGTYVDETITTIAGDSIPPIVLVDGYSENGRFDNVVSDNFRAAYQAVSYLIDKGHRHIGLVGGDTHCYPSLNERRNGYRRALKDNNLKEVYTADFNINRSKGFSETLSLLQEYPHLTALFCVNDDIGSHAIRAVNALGKRVPADVSIIGYDDTYLALNTQPALTTMHVDTVAMGRAAVHLLALRIDNPESARMSLTIHSTLVERESVAARLG
ncbi:MAG: LacI family DNA-binding transcriptional regulator [Anaerolineales bacterium]